MGTTRSLVAASLRYRNRAEITVLMCEQKPPPPPPRAEALSSMVFAPAQKVSGIQPRPQGAFPWPWGRGCPV